MSAQTATEPVATLEGQVHTWTLDKTGENVRKYTTVTIPFGLAREVFKADKFNANTGRGEQRDLVPPQVRALRTAMLNGTYTPTPVSIGLRPRHREAMVLDGDTVKLPIYQGDQLPQTDGQQRFGALAEIWKLAKEAGDDEMLKLVEAAPITATINLDGDTKEDFINLQLGRSVDASHMLSLKVKAGLLGDKEKGGMKIAFGAAKVLADNPDSPFAKLIRFDSKAGTTAVSKLPITTLAAKGTSDLATSLFGLARVGGDEADAGKLAYSVVAAYNAIKDKHPELLEEGMPLTPPTEGGTKGSATMIVGLGVCLAYRLKMQGLELPEQADLDKLVKAAKKTLKNSTRGNFSSQTKRELMREFAGELFHDLRDKDTFHEGIPVGLLRTLSCSTFAVSPLPKEVSPRTRQGVVATGNVVLPDVDGELPWEDGK